MGVRVGERVTKRGKSYMKKRVKILLCHKAKQRRCIYSTYDFMISHHIIKLLINFFILFFCVRSEDI